MYLLDGILHAVFITAAKEVMFSPASVRLLLIGLCQKVLKQFSWNHPGLWTIIVERVHQIFGVKWCWMVAILDLLEYLTFESYAVRWRHLDDVDKKNDGKF